MFNFYYFSSIWRVRVNNHIDMVKLKGAHTFLPKTFFFSCLLNVVDFSSSNLFFLSTPKACLPNFLVILNCTQENYKNIFKDMFYELLQRYYISVYKYIFSFLQDLSIEKGHSQFISETDASMFQEKMLLFKFVTFSFHV